MSPAAEPFDYVVVGSGAGGGTVAARLAEAGCRVLLLEAGGDPRRLAGGDRATPGESRLPDDYDVPAFHPFASENEALRWDFFVRHYDDDARQQRDAKYCASWGGQPVDGVLYPRAGTLGGCTAHNAMIMVYPHNADWDGIAALTGDPSWRAEAMRQYFVRIENCQHRRTRRRLAEIGIDPSRHGWRGWLWTERAVPTDALKDRDLVATIVASAQAAFRDSGWSVGRLQQLLEGEADPNDWRLVCANAEGVRYTPLTTRQGRRVGARERVLETIERHPDRLVLELDALATRVLLDDRRRAVGVEYLKGERLYRAHGRPSAAAGERCEARAREEVILAGGAFNTPQLLMLSGIGEPGHLAGHGIAPRIELPGVGRNLQDRYEVCVVNRMAFDRWRALADARFRKGDPPYLQWAKDGSGLYATNGAGLAVIKRSTPQRELPDLFCMALLADFAGYFPGYANRLAERRNCLSWAVLKAHTSNRGEVRLRSADPREPPRISFRYFEEGGDGAGEDLAAMVDAIRFVRRMTRSLKEQGLIEAEELPGEQVQATADLERFVRDNAWGHHASCSCAIGPREQGGVLSGDFKVHGVEGLRVVDASAFPRIPGFFIVSAVYMIGEKAADAILADRRARSGA